VGWQPGRRSSCWLVWPSILQQYVLQTRFIFRSPEVSADRPITESVPARSHPSRSGLIKGNLESLSELRSIVVGPEMHEQQSRLLVEHVAMNGGNLDPVRAQAADERIDLLARAEASRTFQGALRAGLP